MPHAARLSYSALIGTSCIRWRTATGDLPRAAVLAPHRLTLPEACSVAASASFVERLNKRKAATPSRGGATTSCKDTGPFGGSTSAADRLRRSIMKEPSPNIFTAAASTISQLAAAGNTT